MGSGRWTDDDWESYSKKNTKGKTTEEIYDNNGPKSIFLPRNIKTRESCDSPDNPNSTPVIVALDVTASMNPVLDNIVRKGLNTLITEIYDRKPIPDPHLMLMAVGDHKYDSYPLQCTQFEADIRIAEQLKELYLERGGGGNNWESYHLPWIFAGLFTTTDSMVKRNKKGYIFTIGDESVPKPVSKSKLIQIFGDRGFQSDISAEDALIMAKQQYEIFHVLLTQGSNYRKQNINEWKNIIGQNLLILDDKTKISEVIISAIQLAEGEDTEEVINSWDGSTAMAVRNAVGEYGLSNNLSDEIITFE